MTDQLAVSPPPASIRRLSAVDAVTAIRATRRRVVTFLGFSGAGYEDADAVARTIERTLLNLDPRTVTICAGATGEGIGAVYAIARRRGFPTLGIVSSLAEQEGATFAPDVDAIYIIADPSWGGRTQDGTLAPVSAAMVGAGDEFIAIGGGDIARDEAAAAQAARKPVRYIAADMNHAAAIDKAHKTHRPEPQDFAGTLRQLFPQGE